MDKKVKQLFDYQKFENNKELSKAIEICEKSGDFIKQKPKVMSVYRKITLTMTASTALATFFLVMNYFFVNTPIEVGNPTGVASVFSNINNGFIIAGTIFALGIIVSVILYKKDKGNR